MTAIKIHHTATDTEGTWDGPAEEAKLATPITGEVAQGMYGWYDQNAPDDDGDGWPDAKDAYKFPHHNIVNGKQEAANINGVNNALSRLDQADIPEADKAGVRAHMEAHRKDAGLQDHFESPRQIREPIRCFEGNAQPHERFWGLRKAEETGGAPELEFYGVISEYSWYDDDITPKMFKDDLYNLGKGGPITVRINSPGGSLDAASTIRSILSTYPGQVTARIDGMCASAATLVALAGQKIKMQDSATFMIHEPWIGVMMAILTLDVMEALTNSLQQGVRTLTEVYGSKTGISSDRLKKMMHDETWLSAQDALALGFVDEVVGAKEKAVAGAAVMNSISAQSLLKHYVNVPSRLQTSLKRETVDLEREAQRLREEVKLTI